MPVHAHGESNSLPVCRYRKTDIALGNAEMKQVKDALLVRGSKMPVHAHGESNSLPVRRYRKTDIALGNAETKQVEDACF